MYAVLVFELKSYLSNRMALFWTVAYPIAMLIFLVMVFDPRTPIEVFYDSYKFKTTVGLVSLTIVSTALFGMGQAMSDMRTHRALVPYMFLPQSTFRIVFSILLSRIIVIFGFSVIFLIGAFVIMGLNVSISPIVGLQIAVSILVTSLFSFALVLPMIAVSKNATTIISLANILNIYALMTSGVFVPLAVMPTWSHVIVTSSPFYYLNVGLQNAFQSVDLMWFWGLHLAMAMAGIAITYLVSTRKMMVPA